MRKMILFLSALLLATTASFAFAIEAPDVAVRVMTEGKALPDFNLESVSRSVLGKKWNEASAEQKLAFQTEFRKVLLKRYSESIAKYKNQPAVYTAMPVQANGWVTVFTNISGVQPINIMYTIEKQSDAWKVVDIIIEGVSLITNYRSQYSQEIQQNGLDSLIKKLKENSAGSSTVAQTGQSSAASSSNQTAELPDDPQVLGASASPNAGKAKGKKKK